MGIPCVCGMGNERYYTRSLDERSSENLIVRFSDDLEAEL